MPAVAAAGFAAAAGAYERARPGYPREAVEWLARRTGIAPGCDVLDLAAGTGKLTRQLVPLGARVVAVEPVAEMRELLVAAVPGVRALAGTAEEIPLEDASLDAVVVGQAWHWFRAEEALREVHRVLRPGGALALIWNLRDLTDPLQAALEQLLLPHRGDVQTLYEGPLDEPIERSGLFGPLDRCEGPHEQMVGLEELVERQASTSYVAVLREPTRSAFLDDVRAAAETFGEPYVLRYVTTVWAADRR